MSGNHILAYIMLACSVLTLGGGIVLSFWRFHWRSKMNSRRAYFFSIFLLVSVFFLEIAYTVGRNCGTAAQQAADVFSGALQFFSLDLDYSEMVQFAPCAFVGNGVYLYYIVFCAYTLVVPITGMCFIGQLLCSFIPRCRLAIDCKRTKFVFSELNERSVTLAEDIARLSWELRKKSTTCEREHIDPKYERWLKSACLIFTDAYADRESETGSELISRAKRIGAICLKDDIAERRFGWLNPHRKIVYFLMDLSEENNIVTAVSLLSEKRDLWKRTITAKNGKGVRKTKIYRRRTDNMEMYVFTANEEAPAIIENAFLFHSERYCVRKKGKNVPVIADCDKNIIVKTINEFRNLVYDEIFDDHELFSRLNESPPRGNDRGDVVGRNLWYRWLNYYRSTAHGPQEERAFRVAILGGGRIGKEFYKTVCWCGQMLASLRRQKEGEREEKIYPTFDLVLSVLSKNAKDFEQMMRLEAPALFGDAGLRAGFYTTTFNSFSTERQDMEDFGEVFARSGAADANMFLVAFGNDEINLLAARWIERKIKTERGTATPVTIFYVIENDDLLEVLAKEEEKENGDGTDGGCVLKVCGSLRSRLKLKNVFMSGLEHRALQAERMHEYGCKDGRKFMSGFNRESSVATALHFSNRALSLKIGRPVRDEDVGLDERDLRVIFADEKTVGGRVDQLYFLEHRRWYVYMLAQGYRCMTADQFLAGAFDGAGGYLDGGRKSEKLRLHACLLKCGADFHTIEELLEACAKASLDRESYALLCRKKGELAQRQLGAKRRQEETVALFKGSLKQQTERLKKLIVSDRAKGENGTLAEWLDRAVAVTFDEEQRGKLSVSKKLPNGTESSCTPDSLDKLSLIATLCSAGEGFQDFKSYDVKIARNLYLDVLRRQVMKQLAAKEPPAAETVAPLCENWEGWYRLEASSLGGGKVSAVFDYDAVAWSETFEAILLRVGNSLQTEEEAGDCAIGLQDRQGNRYLLAKVPQKGSVCIGRVNLSGKTYDVHLFRKRHIVEPLSAMSREETEKFYEERVKLEGEVDIEARLLEERGSMGEKRLLKILNRDRKGGRA